MRILSLLVVLLAVNFGAQAQAWITYRSEAGRYQIDMPGTPEFSSPLIKLKDGSMAPNHVADVTVGPVTYLASYVDYPASLVKGMTGEHALEQVRDGTANGHKLIRDKPITIAGNPGREYVVMWTEDVVLVIRSTIVGTRLYQIVYSTVDRKEPTSPDVRHFLDSFALK